MRFQCPFCSNVIEIPEEYRGYRVACSHCDKRIVAPSSSFEEGCVIGDFVIRAKLGEGANGAVYKAFQLSLERIVALKILFNKNITEKGLIEFQREARAAAKLIHVNLVQSYAVGEDNGICYMAMTYINGETLKSRIRRTGRIPCDEALHIIQQVAEALHYAWTESRLIHRDVKPDNIMLSENGIVKLTDLGLAMNQAEWRQDMDISGSPSYMSPEQFAGETLDTRSDIYSLGVTLYQMLSAELPFDAETLRSIARQHFEVAVPDINKKVSGLPPSVGKLIKKMMAKTPDKRFRDMEEVLSEIWQIRQQTAPNLDMVPDVHTISLRRLDYEAQLQTPKSDSATPPAAIPEKERPAKTSNRSFTVVLLIIFLMVSVLAFLAVTYRKNTVVQFEQQAQQPTEEESPVYKQLEQFKQLAEDPEVTYDELHRNAQPILAALEQETKMLPIRKEALQTYVLSVLQAKNAAGKEEREQTLIAELSAKVHSLELDLKSSRANEEDLNATLDERQAKIIEQSVQIATREKELELMKEDLKKTHEKLLHEQKLAQESVALIQRQINEQVLLYWQEQNYAACATWLDEMMAKYSTLNPHLANLKKYNSILNRTAEKLLQIKNECSKLALYSGTVSHLENGIVFCYVKDAEGSIKVNKIPWYELPADDIFSLVSYEKKSRSEDPAPPTPVFTEQELPLVHAVYLILTGDCTSIYSLQTTPAEDPATPQIPDSELLSLRNLADTKALILAEQIRLLCKHGKTPVKTLFLHYQKFCKNSPFYQENMKEFLPHFEKKEPTRSVEKTVVP